MLCFNVFWILILTVWGLIGIHTDKFGFKHVWEIWLYQAYYGLMVCPWYAYSQTMISEVSPLSQMCVSSSLYVPRNKMLMYLQVLVFCTILSGECPRALVIAFTTNV